MVGAMLTSRARAGGRRRSTKGRTFVTIVVAAVAFLFSPYLIYKQVAFQFDAADLRAAVHGTWRLELAPERGPASSITFSMEQAPSSAHVEHGRDWIRPASACDSRTLVRSAEACHDTTEMPLRLVAIAGDRSLALAARLQVRGLTFERGLLDIEVAGRIVRAVLSSSGAVLEVRADGATVSLTRLAPSAAGR